MHRQHHIDGGLCSGMLPDLALARDARDLKMILFIGEVETGFIGS
jgi:hypothetical protein